MKDSINTANIQCVEADYVGSDTSDTPSANWGSTAGASARAESDSDKEDHREACRLLPRFVGPLTEDQTNAAMSHNSFDDIAHLVTEFLTRHPETWWIDKHYGMCTPEYPCPCCISNKNPSCREPLACQLCSTAWSLSAVSKAIRDDVLASMTSHPR